MKNRKIHIVSQTIYSFLKSYTRILDQSESFLDDKNENVLNFLVNVPAATCLYKMSQTILLQIMS